MKDWEITSRFFEMLKNNEVLNIIMNSTQDGIQIVDAKGTIIYMNRAALDIIKVTSEDRIGKNIRDVSPGAALEIVLNTRKPVSGNFNIIPESKVEIFANAAPIYIEGVFVGAIVIFRDITILKALLSELEETKKRLNNIHYELYELTAPQYSFANIVGQSKEIKRCISLAKRASKSDATVLITGESGTGKEVFAHAIHRDSERAHGPFIKINCAAIPENLIESELFGHCKGAFTGAIREKIGKFELANGGTIFLDEIGDMDMQLQGKLLRVLQDKEIVRVGENKGKKVDVRIIAATNKNLIDIINEGKFREDLYFRLDVVNIELPPLQNRVDDIPELADNILTKLNNKYHVNVKLENKLVEKMQRYSWPGNVRELENFLEKYVIMSGDDFIGADYFSIKGPNQHKKNHEELLSLKAIEKNMIEIGLKKYGNTLKGKKQIAQKLDIGLSTLYKRMKEYGFDVNSVL